jgi:biopolymer transport protein ExbD
MSSNFGSSGNEGEVELNITPIIDCFTVLITFLLASASFISIGFFDAYTPGNAADPGQNEPDTEAIIKIKSNQVAEFTVKGKRNYKLTFDMKQKDALLGLEGELKKLHDEKVNMNNLLVSADDDVDYQVLAELMNHLNESKFPVVVGEF